MKRGNDVVIHGNYLRFEYEEIIAAGVNQPLRDNCQGTISGNNCSTFGVHTWENSRKNYQTAQIISKGCIAGTRESPFLNVCYGSVVLSNKKLRNQKIRLGLTFNIELEEAIQDSNTDICGNIFYKSVQLLAYAEDIDIVARGVLS
ncbi:hypothetical protein CEXT_688451 [Caerostris extrusa]|uniref:Uncharacterized protein n=1 Tax=Caerostris extrusa TaxID=172846 RepID=A0AAV4Y2L7_CAEEX|nr:hypothetical protein CEXT_688451 [Caerostris extrusa]